MRKLVCLGLSSLLSLSCFGALLANPDLSGKYHCSGYDSHDIAYANATLILTLDAKDSDLSNGYAAYHLLLTEQDGIQYVGEAAANGNMLGVYFENTGVDAKAKTDRGVGIEIATHDSNRQGKTETVLHKFYYEPNYFNGGNGLQTCIKQTV